MTVPWMPPSQLSVPAAQAQSPTSLEAIAQRLAAQVAAAPAAPVWAMDVPPGAVDVNSDLLQQLAIRQNNQPTLLDSLVSAAGMQRYPLVMETRLPDGVYGQAQQVRNTPVVMMSSDQGFYDKTGMYSVPEVLKHEVGHHANLPADGSEESADDWRRAFDLARDMTGVTQIEADMLWRMAPEGVRNQMMQLLREQSGVFNKHPFLRSRAGGRARAEQRRYELTTQIHTPINIQPNGRPQRASRNNNPGNLRYYSDGRHAEAVSDEHGEFSVFPSRQDGWAAHLNNLARNYYEAHPNMSLREFVEKYAPKSDGNDVDAYVKHLQEWLRLPDETYFIQDFPLEAFAEAVVNHESGTKIKRVPLPEALNNQRGAQDGRAPRR